MLNNGLETRTIRHTIHLLHHHVSFGSRRRCSDSQSRVFRPLRRSLQFTPLLFALGNEGPDPWFSQSSMYSNMNYRNGRSNCEVGSLEREAPK